eukprot:m.167169 g.167169  ORF g.167169 m.167169 type:complete len:87 (-) comp12790_c0_seq1:26-286(-)
MDTCVMMHAFMHVRLPTVPLLFHSATLSSHVPSKALFHPCSIMPPFGRCCCVDDTPALAYIPLQHQTQNDVFIQMTLFCCITHVHL